MNAVLELFFHGLVLSLLAVGGAVSTTPDWHRRLVEEGRWLSDAQFASAISISQVSPGPNLLFVPVLGYQVAGLAGAAATMLGTLIPSTSLALLANRWMLARADSPAVLAIKAGLAPITLALLLAAGWLLAAPAPHRASWLLTAACALLAWRTRVHILAMLGAGAVLGLLGWV